MSKKQPLPKVPLKGQEPVLSLAEGPAAPLPGDAPGLRVVDVELSEPPPAAVQPPPPPPQSTMADVMAQLFGEAPVPPPRPVPVVQPTPGPLAPPVLSGETALIVTYAREELPYPTLKAEEYLPRTPQDRFSQMRCLECNRPMWTRNQKKEDTCEECGFILRERFHELRVRHETGQGQGFIDPFRDYGDA